MSYKIVILSLWIISLSATSDVVRSILELYTFTKVRLKMYLNKNSAYYVNFTNKLIKIILIFNT